MTCRKFLVLGVVLLAGCASRSEDIDATYYSTSNYSNYNCEQLQQEAQKVSYEATVAAGKQDKARDGDAVKTAVGVALFWPVLLFNEGDGRNAAYLAQLKGQKNAIQEVSSQKDCGINFTQ